MMPSQLSKRGLFLATLLIAMYFVCAAFYDRWYSSTYSGFVGYERLARLDPGTPFDEVADRYSHSYRITATDIVDPEPSKHGRVLLSDESFYAGSSLIELVKNQLADAEPGDELYYFEASDGGGSFLQFRNGKLINFSPSTFKPAVRLARLNHSPVPSVLLRFGVLPIYLPFAALLFYCFCRLHRPRDASRNSDGSSSLVV